jgi:HsdM N-terminal domain
MALKKSELYSSLWASCDELRGGMDASQYKDYVLVLLFIKYVSDKFAGQPYAAITIPPGASFKDMVALKGKPDIGDQINKKIIAPLAKANKLSDFPDFNDPAKLGSGKEMVDRLTNLIAIFENPALNFTKNRAEDDDILGDAYEYLMRHFATESGKTKFVRRSFEGDSTQFQGVDPVRQFQDLSDFLLHDQDSLCCQPDPLVVGQQDAFVLFLLLLQDPNLLFEVVDCLPEFLVDAIRQARHDRKP